MDQQTVTYLLIAALLVTALLIALAVVVPRMPRRGAGVDDACDGGRRSPMLLDSDHRGESRGNDPWQPRERQSRSRQRVQRRRR